jgi:hypothetical protein
MEIRRFAVITATVGNPPRLHFFGVLGVFLVFFGVFWFFSGYKSYALVTTAKGLALCRYNEPFWKFAVEPFCLFTTAYTLLPRIPYSVRGTN